MTAGDIVTALACGGAGCACGQTKAAGHGNTHCPSPNHKDSTPSLSVDPGNDGRPLLKCHAGCDQTAVIEALRNRNLWHTNATKTKGARGSSPSPRGATIIGTLPGLTVAAYATAKQLPENFLRELGLSDIHTGGQPAIRLPYRSADGTEVAVRLRCALEGAHRFRWRKGSRLAPYGLERLPEAQAMNSIVIVEGESDAQTLWHHKIPALGLPGASTWKEAWTKYLDGIATVYVVREPDRGGDTLAAKLAASSLRERISFLQFGEKWKDPSALHLHNPAGFRKAWDAIIAEAVPWSTEHEVGQAKEAAAARAEAEALLHDPQLLERIREAITAGGYAGDTTAPIVVYLAGTSRLLPTPINVGLVAISAAGKTAAADSGLGLIPEEAVYRLKASSQRVLIYSDADYAHRIVYFAEVDSIPDDGPAASAVRSLAEANSMEYFVVERDPESGKHVVRHIVKPGPTGLITTSTRSLKEQLGTRLLELPVLDDKEQTGRVIRAHASRVSGRVSAPVDVGPFLALQRWLAVAGIRKVVVPFAEELASLIPPAAVRMRRDSRQLFTAIQTVAFLYQCQRERDASGAIVATVEDYAMVRELLSPIFDTIVAQGVTPAVRETVEAIGPEEEVSETALIERLHLSKNAVSYRVRRAVEDGWLNNLETRRGCRARLVRGAPLPDGVSALPTPEKLREVYQCPNRIRSGDTSPPPPSRDGADRERFTL
jgi:hypothetical protein